jgi:hypothetical protein
MPMTWVWTPRVTVSLLDRFAVPPYREGTSACPGTHPNEAVVEGEVTWCSARVRPDHRAGFHDEARGSGRGEEG